MPRTVAEKLRIAPGGELLFIGTDGQLALLGPLPEDVVVIRGIERDTTGTAFAFADDRAALDALLQSAFPHLDSFRAAWIGYRKGGRSDINRDSIWERVKDFGWTLNANTAISDGVVVRTCEASGCGRHDRVSADRAITAAFGPRRRRRATALPARRRRSP